jgi:RNA polymerase sigma-70 factor (ECF subfamily)
MEPGEVMAMPAAVWGTEYLEDTSHRRLVLEYYDREHVSLRRYLLFLGLDPESCREAVQESFLRLHEHLLAGGDQANLRAWLYRVAHNLARNHQTAFHASRTGPLADVTETEDIPANAGSAEDELLAKERMQRLSRAMEELSAAQRDCLILRSQGLKYREIAEVLNLAISTVGENIQRGLERLKGTL